MLFKIASRKNGLGSMDNEQLAAEVVEMARSAGADEAEVMLLRAQLAEALRTWMERETLTQAKAAKRLGIAQRRVSEIVRGKVEPHSFEYLVRLWVKVGISVRMPLTAERVRRG